MGGVGLNPVDIFEKNVIPIVRNISINKNIIPVSKYIYNILENDKTSELKIKKIHSWGDNYNIFIYLGDKKLSPKIEYHLTERNGIQLFDISSIKSTNNSDKISIRKKTGISPTNYMLQYIKNEMNDGDIIVLDNDAYDIKTGKPLENLYEKYGFQKIIGYHRKEIYIKGKKIYLEELLKYLTDFFSN